MKTEGKERSKSRSLDNIIPELLGISIHLKLSVPRGFADTLRKFVKDHGLHPKFDVRKILEYGLAQESDEELERLERERCQPSSEVHTNYAVTKFKAYENLMDNKALTLKLQFLVSENERLRRVLLEKGLIDSIETEWTKEKINEFQRKYLFGQKT
jgi:hypothetical protein